MAAQDDSGDGGWFAQAQSGAGLIGGLTAFYQPFISQHWAQSSSSRAYKRAVNMYKHRYQWATEDLKKAGLNPALAYTQGVAGSMAAPVAAHAEYDVDGDAIGRAMSSAESAFGARSRLKMLRDAETIRGNEVEQSRHETFRVMADSHRAESEAKIAEMNRDILEATKESAVTSAKQSADQSVQLTDQMRLNLELQRAQLPSAKAMAEWDASPAGQLLLKAGRITGPASGLVSGAIGGAAGAAAAVRSHRGKDADDFGSLTPKSRRRSK